MSLSLYVDGGCIVRNPSPYGGTYGVVLVQSGRVIEEKSGVIDAATLGYEGCCSNNVAELYALSLGILTIPEGAECGIYSDSENALGRIFQAWRLGGVPLWLCAMRDNARKHLRKLARFQYDLVQGHPNKAELAAGVTIERRNKKGAVTQIGGLPVSEWNVYADGLCRIAADRWQEERKAAK